MSTVRGVSCLSRTRFASVAGDSLALWDLTATYRAGRTLDYSDDVVVDVDVRPGPSGEIAVATTGAIAIYESDSPVPRALDLEGVVPKVIAYSPDGMLLGVGGRSPAGKATILIYDAALLVPKGRTEFGQAGHTVTAIDLLDEHHVAAGTTQGDVALLGGIEPMYRPLPTGREVERDRHGPGWGGRDRRRRRHDVVRPFQRPDSFESVELGRPINDIVITSDGTVVAGTSDGAIVTHPRALGRWRRAVAPPNSGRDRGSPYFMTPSSRSTRHSMVRSFWRPTRMAPPSSGICFARGSSES